MTMMSAIPAPFDAHRETVRPEWIDYNDHMNVAFYVLVFDHGTDAFFEWLGMGETYRQRTNCSSMALETHITYQGEVRLGDPLRVTTQLVGFDVKRIHFFHRMYHAEKGYLAATYECLSIHVDLGQRRSAPFPADLQRRLSDVAAAHACLPRPAELGRSVGLGRGRPA